MGDPWYDEVKYFVRADMSEKADIEALIAGTVEAYGRLDFAVNNAGIEGTLFVPTADYSEDTWDEVINTTSRVCGCV